ncbi:MAG: UDP-GlcNAc:undecaprenyl-phosphate/decaprenyl-phosphate GlcNAc-phosphate transferase [Solirubrobacteraceae bacterium]|nr:UDP-GlcNAc:undecaprenyl-phosphate/decaprenyl-phosphate GlcNAc-phosphate transferase [Solirubrobacteraceae bacterium]
MAATPAHGDGGGACDASRVPLDEFDALVAAAVAAAVTALLTPLVGRVARRLGAVDKPRDRGLSSRLTPLLGGVAIFAGVLVAALLWLPTSPAYTAILAGAAVITLVGAVDDVIDLHPAVKLAGQVGAVLIPVTNGVTVDNFTLPFVHRVDLGGLGAPLTLIGIVLVINVVNFSDGVDGLAAGVCAIAASSFAIIAFDLGKASAAVLAAIIAGAALGFLVHNFHPASVFMGDCGSNLLGYLLGTVIVEGSLKTNALIALIGPLVVLAVPFLDTGFVLAKRLKYRRPVYQADRWHFHHRMANIGFSQRRTVLYLYAWMSAMAGLAVALRFVPYSDGTGHLNAGWSLVMGGLFVVVLAASVYLVYVLEILKFRRLDAIRLRRVRPDATEAEIDADVEQRLATGEFDAVRRETEDFPAL